jgi:hypothetical protein
MQNYVVNDTLDLQITLPIASKRKSWQTGLRLARKRMERPSGQQDNQDE